MSAIDPSAFVRSIYLGDRGCISIKMDGWKHSVSLEVDTLSRIRSESGLWEYYSDEDIENARITFTGVRSIAFEPPGPVPNDLINSLSAAPTGREGEWLFELSIDAVSSAGERVEVKVAIVAADLHLEDPSRPGLVIRD